MRKFGTIILFITSFYCCQYILLSSEPEEIFENVLESSLLELEESSILDDFEYYSTFPIPLLTCNSITLSRLPSIDYHLALGIVELVQLRGIRDYKVLFDSLNISDFQKEVLIKCTYIYREDIQPSPTRLRSRFRLQSRIENVKGFENESFRGSNLDYLFRSDYRSENIEIGILSNKDAGEPAAFDFLSGFVKLGISGHELIIGDFAGEFGLGNILWRNFGMRKGAEVIAPTLQLGRGIVPYRSSTESNYFRGAALKNELFEISGNKISTTAFYSTNNRGATIDRDDLIVTSLKNDGYYRTETEISKKNALNETIAGILLQSKGSKLSFGVSALSFNYEYPIVSQSSVAFSGKSGLNLSAFAKVKFGENFAAAELSSDANSNFAFKSTYAMIDKDYELAFHFRHFAEFFRAQFGYKFGESSSASNESGIYTGLVWKGLKNTKLSIYTDFYETLGRTFTVPVTLTGVDLLGEIVHKFSRNNTAILRFRFEDKSDAVTIDGFKRLVEGRRASARIEFKSFINTSDYCRVRLEISNKSYDYYIAEKTGFLIFGEYSVELAEYWRAGCRLSYFNTDTYDAAIWQYEYAMPGYATSHALYGSGIRYYIYSNVKLPGNLRLWLRYANTTKNNVYNLHGSLTEIEGNSSSNIQIQLDFLY